MPENELDREFRSLDLVPAPDRWPDLGDIHPQTDVLERRWTRAATALLALVIASVGVLVATRTFLGAPAQGPTGLQEMPSRIFRPAPRECPIPMTRARTLPFLRLADRLEGHVPRWLPEGFGLAHAFGSGEGYQASGMWSDGRCRQVQVYLYPDPHTEIPAGPRVDDWVVVTNAPNQCANAVLGKARCLDYWARAEGGRLTVQMIGLDRDEGDRIVRSISTGPLATQTGPSPLMNSQEEMIAFSDHGAGGWDIFAMNSEGSHVIPMVQSPGDDVTPRLSRNGRKLAYVNISGPDAVYLLDEENDRAQPIHVFGPDEQVSDMAWSPDATRLAIVVEEVRGDPPGSRRPSYIHVLDIGTGFIQRITHTGRENSVDWSPDGSTILFGRSGGPLEGNERFTSNDLYLINPDGSDETRLTTDGLSMEGTWSPDGTHISFTSYSPSQGGQTDIYVMRADGTGRTKLTDNPGMDYLPVWAPDGSRILFVSRRTDGPPAGPSSCHLVVIGIVGLEEESIIRDASHICGGDPSWA
jgi:Tol biopolymer transport system component